MNFLKIFFIAFLIFICFDGFSQEPILKQKSNFRQKASVGITFYCGISKISSQTLNNLSLANDHHEWTTKNEKIISPEISLWCNINSHLGLRTGIGYINPESTFSLEGVFSSPDIQIDVNDNKYLEFLSANFDSTLSISYISLPFSIRYLYHFNYKFSVYTEAGITTSYCLKSEYQLRGNYTSYGFYESNPESFQEVYLTELGFGETRYNPPVTEELKTSPFYFSGYLSLGLLIQTNTTNFFQIGPKIQFGLNSITNSEEYYDIFGTKHDVKPTRINGFGLEISYIRKL